MNSHDSNDLNDLILLPDNPRALPVSPTPPSSSSSTHQPSSSADFGSFNSAPVLAPPLQQQQQRNYQDSEIQLHSHPVSQPTGLPVVNTTSLLDDDDLLGSFDHSTLQRVHKASSQRPFQSTTPISMDVDLLGGDVWEDVTPHSTHNNPKVPPSTPHYSPQPSRRSMSPVHIPLPPRPSEISPDYAPPPPLKSPRRMSSPYFSLSLSSPPIVTDAGNDIIFHPAHQPKDDGAAREMRKVQQHDPGITIMGSSNPSSSSEGSDLRRTITRSPPHHSKLLDTLATTSKIASKWRSAITKSTFTPPHNIVPAENQYIASTKHSEPVPIDITHQSPFATAEQVAGSYRAPSGAPGFDPRQNASPRYNDKDDEWGKVTLSGRRDSTEPVLTSADAYKLRGNLPPRQRLSGNWTLLFSLDQHGASLSTLYRLVERYGQTHRTSGNLLVVRDGRGNRFGAYINESIVKREGTYYGTGESFLFKLDPVSGVQVYRWTGKNQYFALCESGFISFGGGDGTYGLLLDSTFTQNSSATCPAYDNEILSESSPRKSQKASLFDCVGLEVWGT
ncbi:hypothetical protein I203_105396 [Kwoniella mangroviensis CBS 8507]|uniref:uncharacterized protein n=1 Tax=Kwoniella mangroviensis CBS 8507 TaxID=1296122 RepID=UPI00080D3520|nr:uncharacterized protein I203_01213 [Kwoniella mangroviensis CBS 8507]OCF69356.1 hypothetical protein I203_01213 [Kwoniella mangroviensis CBS 8507]